MSWHTDDTAWLHASTANAPHIFDIDHSFSGLLYTVPAGYVNADEYSLSSHHSPSEPPLQRSGSAQSTPVPSHHSAHSSNPFTPRSSRHSSEASRSEYAFDSPPYPSTWDHEDESPDNWTDPDPQTPSPHFLELVQSPVNAQMEMDEGLDSMDAMDAMDDILMDDSPGPPGPAATPWNVDSYGLFYRHDDQWSETRSRVSLTTIPESPEDRRSSLMGPRSSIPSYASGSSFPAVL